MKWWTVASRNGNWISGGVASRFAVYRLMKEVMSMDDYEILMVVFTVIGLLIAVRNR